MVLDEKRILETAEKIRNGIENKRNLKELMGGTRLDDIFDQRTQEALFDNIVDNGKIHNMLQNGNGIDTLEGLLNNQISSNLSDFYMIKPDYILQLPHEQQKNMANSIAGGRQDLSAALQNLWSKGIRTEACTTKSSDNIPMLQLNIKGNEYSSQDIIQQLYEQSDIQGNSFYNYLGNEFSINLSGANLYEYLRNESIPSSQISKTNIFESAVKESLENAEELYEYYSRNGMDTTELRREILTERKSLLDINNRMKNKAQNSSQISSHEFDEGLRSQSNGDTNLPVKQSRFSRFYNQVRARFLQRSANKKEKNSLSPNRTDATKASEQQVSKKTQAQDKKSWELEPAEKEKIQKEQVEIANRHREQLEQPNNQQQIMQEQGNEQVAQGQIPVQPPMDFGGMEL